MTTKHEIEIPDLPEGWRAVAFRIPVGGVDYVFITSMNEVRLCDWETKTHKALIVEKIKPRRIVLEDTQGDMPVDEDNTDWIYHRSKWWRVVEEE